MLQQSGPSRIQSDHVPLRTSREKRNSFHPGNNKLRHSSAGSKGQAKMKHDVTCSNPAVPNKSRLVDRIMTFYGWINTLLASPKLFSEAGFFYLDSGDKVKCFNCGGGLGGWRPNEDPFYEHAKWFPECEYIQLYMGVEYVANVVKKHPGLNRPSIHNPIPLPAIFSPMRRIVADDRFNSTETSVIDENLTLNERVEKELKGEIVENAMMFGFVTATVRKLIRRKLERENVGYTSVMTLVEDLQNEDRKEENGGEEIMDIEPIPSTCKRQRPTSLTSSPMSSTSSSWSSPEEIVADSFSNNVSSIPAGQLLMGPSLDPSLFPFERSSNSLPPSPATPSPPPSPVNSFSGGLGDDDMIHENDRCKVCLDRRSDCLFMPCNHLCCCTSCASALKTCPVCRTKLKSILKIYRR